MSPTFGSDCIHRQQSVLLSCLLIKTELIRVSTEVFIENNRDQTVYSIYTLES